MGFVAAIVGLAVIVLVHEAGHFFAARAGGMTPRKFYLGFGPPIVKTTRGGVEYGIGSLPLGGYVKIPGMNRPSAGPLEQTLADEDKRTYRTELARLDEAIEAGDDAAARAALAELPDRIRDSRLGQELGWSLAPDAYWRQKTWRRLLAIGAGPAINLVAAFVLFAGLFVVATEHGTTRVAQVVGGSPAAHAGLQAGDRLLVVNGVRVTPNEIAPTIRATKGAPFRIVVARHGRRVAIGPLSAHDEGGTYRIGIALRGTWGPGESPPAAARDALKLTWQIVADTARSVAHLATGRDTNQVSSSVGIVRASQRAWKAGLRDFLFTMGLISLALGLMNLLPILPLDGGHIVMALVEKLRGRTFSQTVYVRYSVIGLSIFALLMYFGFRNDLFGSG